MNALKHFATVERISLSSFNLFEQRDSQGATPLSLALQSYSVPKSMPQVSLILDVAPCTSAVPDEHGFLPIVSATRLQLPDNIVQIMLAHDMPIELGIPESQNVDSMNVANIVHRIHNHSWWHVSVNCEDRYLDMIRAYLINSATVFQTMALAEQVGPDGSILCNHVSPAYRHMLRSLLILYNRYEIQTTLVFGSVPFTLIALDHGLKPEKATRKASRQECRKVSSILTVCGLDYFILSRHHNLVIGFTTLLPL